MLKCLFLERAQKKLNMRRGTRTGYVSAQSQGLGNTPNPRVKRAAVFHRRAARFAPLSALPGQRRPLRDRAVPSAPVPAAGWRGGPGVPRVSPRHAEDLCLSFSGDSLYNKPS